MKIGEGNGPKGLKKAWIGEGRIGGGTY